MADQQEQTETFDVVVIGGGPAGENAAQYALGGGEGRTAAIVEEHLLGGECSYYACMPSKALLRPLDVAAAAAHLDGLSGPTVEPAALLARRDEWVSHYDDSGQREWAEGAGITVVDGHGRLAGERTVHVSAPDGTTRVLQARDAVVLATGSVGVVPDLYADALPWGSRDATGVVEVPDSLAIVGGGVVACEAARWMAALGAAVTLLVRDDRLLPRAEPVAGDLVAASLTDAGVDVRFGTEVTGVRRDSPDDTGLGRPHGGPVTLDLRSEGDDGVSREDTLEVAEVLVAIGRRPAVGDLGLETVGLAADDLHGGTGHDTNERLPGWLYTVGDLNGEAPLTHWGKYQARLVGRQIAALAAGEPAPTRPDDVPVPQVVFTDPQVAWVGLTVADAAREGRTTRTLEADYASAAGAALLRDDVAGRAILVVEDGEDGEEVVVGATFVGTEVAELLHSATVAITGRVPLSTLRHAVASYPTASEIWLRLLES